MSFAISETALAHFALLHCITRGQKSDKIMFLLLLAVLLALFILYGAQRYILDKRYNLPPGATPVPFIGNLYVIKPGKPMWEVMRDQGEKYGPIFTFYLAQIRMVVLNNSKIIHEALVSQGDIFNSRIDLTLPGLEKLPPAITTASGDIWRARRRFGVRAMRDFGMGKELMVTNIQDEVVHFLPEIESHVGKPFNPKRLINNAVSNVISSLVFGKRFHYDDAKFHRILHEVELLVAGSPRDNLLFFILPFKRHFSMAPSTIAIRAFIDTVKEMTKEAIAEHRKDFDPENIRSFPDLYLQGETQQDGIDFESFSLVMTDMFIAGTETTSTALAWTLLYLSTFPEIQAKCHEAIDRVIDTNRLPTSKDRPNLLYIDALMCEVLRHASFVPAALYHSNLGIHTKVAGYDIPPYTMIMYNVAFLHRDPSYWKDPFTFDPDRWISPDGKLLSHSSHFMPFGIGPRICLGESLARVEYFVFLVSILHRFRFTLKEPVDLMADKEGLIRPPPDYEITAFAR